MSISWSLVRRSTEYRGVEGTTSKKKASNQTRNRKRDGNAIHRDGEGDQGLRGRTASHQPDAPRAAPAGSVAAGGHRKDQATLGEITMRFMTIVRTRETGAQPSPALIDKIGKLGEEAAKKGAMVGMGGLLPTALGARARLANGRITFTDGPFTEAKEVIGGYALYDVGSKKEAIKGTRKFPEAPIGRWDQELEGEVRQMRGDPSAGC